MLKFNNMFIISSVVCVLSTSCYAINKNNFYNFKNKCDSKINITNKKLDLRDLIEICVCNNPDLASEYLNVEIAKSKKKQQTAEYMPQLSASASTNSEHKNIEDDNNTTDEPYSAKLSLEWLLYDFGGRQSRNKLYKSDIDIANFEYNTKLYDTILSVHTVYLKLLGAQEILKSAEENEKAFKKSFEESSKKYNLGMASLNDKLQAKTQYEESILEVVEARNTIKQYNGELAILLNLSPLTKFNLQEPLINNDITKLDFEDNINTMIETATKNRTEIKKAEKTIEYNKYNLKLAKNNLMPTISAVGSLTYEDDWDKNKYEKTSYIGINVSVPIFAGFANVNKISQANYEYKQAKYDLEVTKNDIANEVWSAYQNYKTAVESYRISQQVVKSAEENLKVSFKSYSVGKIDIISLLTANSKLASAKKDKINNFYNVLITKADLYRKIGEI